MYDPPAYLWAGLAAERLGDGAGSPGGPPGSARASEG